MHKRLTGQRSISFTQAAQAFEKAQQWEDALEAWLRCSAEHPPARPEWIAGYGKALVGLGLLAEAAAVYRELADSHPGSPLGLEGLARAASRLQDHALAVACCDALFDRWPDEVRPGHRRIRARALLKLGHIDDARYAFADLARRAPRSPDGLLGLAAIADLERDRADASRLWDEIDRLFGAEASVVEARIRHELKRGSLDEAERRLATSTIDAESRALLSGEAAFLRGDYARAFAILEDGRRGVSEPHALWSKELALRQQAVLVPGDLDALAAAAEAASSACPGHVTVGEEEVLSLIRANRPDRAGRLIEAWAGQPEAGRDRLLLQSWASFRAGDVERATSTYRAWMGRRYNAAIQSRDLLPLGPGIVGLARPALALFTCVKNEGDYLEWFLSYYRSLGIQSFFVIDNGSTDGSREFLEAQPDVRLFDSEGDFFAAGGGMRWINQLIEAFAGRWALYVDVDEMLIYPSVESQPLSAWLKDVDSALQTAVPAFMVDMYWGPGSDLEAAARNPIAELGYFDANYFAYGSAAFPYFEIGGGPRGRLFATHERLSKVPIVRGDLGLRYVSSHSTTPAALGPHGALLLHFKLLRQARLGESLKPDVSRVQSRSQAAIARHTRYAGIDGIAHLHGPQTQRYCGSTTPAIATLFGLTKREVPMSERMP